MYNLEKDKEKYFRLGKILKTYGYSGEVVLLLDVDQPGEYADMPVIFINIDQTLVPWFISKIALKGDLATIALEDINTEDKARELTGKEVYLPIDRLGTLSEKQFYFHEIIGFSVIDSKHGHIGLIDRVLDLPEQDILSIIHDGREVMVPLSDEMISRIDRKKRILYLETPEGLIDLYL